MWRKLSPVDATSLTFTPFRTPVIQCVNLALGVIKVYRYAIRPTDGQPFAVLPVLLLLCQEP